MFPAQVAQGLELPRQGLVAVDKGREQQAGAGPLKVFEIQIAGESEFFVLVHGSPLWTRLHAAGRMWRRTAPPSSPDVEHLPEHIRFAQGGKGESFGYDNRKRLLDKRDDMVLLRP